MLLFFISSEARLRVIQVFFGSLFLASSYSSPLDGKTFFFETCLQLNKQRNKRLQPIMLRKTKKGLCNIVNKFYAISNVQLYSIFE